MSSQKKNETLQYACGIFAMRTYTVWSMKNIQQNFNNKCTHKHIYGHNRKKESPKLDDTSCEKHASIFIMIKNDIKQTLNASTYPLIKWYVGWPHGIYVPFAYFMMCCFWVKLLQGARLYFIFFLCVCVCSASMCVLSTTKFVKCHYFSIWLSIAPL